VEDLELLAEVAMLYFETGWTQNEIAKHIHTSRSTVSRLLQEAKSKNVVEIKIHYPWDRSPELENQLLKKFGLKDIRVLETRGRQGIDALRGTAVLAARYLTAIIKDTTILGISWGRAVSQTVEMLKPSEKPPMKVVQLFGSAIPNSRFDGSDVVRRCANIYDGECYYIHAPLFVDNAEAHKALISNPHISETLVLAAKADIIVTGIGSLESQLTPSQTWLRYLSQEAVNNLKVRGAAGHICAHHYDLEGNILDIPLHKGIIGIKPRLLHEVKQVIGVTSGTEKARAILGALNGNLINVLITDDTTAKTVLKMAEL